MKVRQNKRFVTVLILLMGFGVGATNWAMASLGSPENYSQVTFLAGSYYGICEAPGTLCQEGEYAIVMH